jgi:hypothetical protein
MIGFRVAGALPEHRCVHPAQNSRETGRSRYQMPGCAVHLLASRNEKLKLAMVASPDRCPEHRVIAGRLNRRFNAGVPNWR